MSSEMETNVAHEVIEVDLRQPGIAAFYAWLLPGAGHLYQRRYAKGVLFMVCILGTYFFGLGLGDYRVVYAAWEPEKEHKRWQYVCQLGVGAPALPAAVQAFRKRSGKDPLWKGFMAAPQTSFSSTTDELADWNLRLNSAFELGTLFTMIAGLLNVLAIYDAYAGPIAGPPEESSEGESWWERLVAEILGYLPFVKRWQGNDGDSR